MAELNDVTSAATLLASRRSGRARDLVHPGPDDAQLERILSSAIRVPDHGKLRPWRVVIIPEDRRRAFADLLRRAYLAQKPDAGRLELEAADAFARQAPSLLVVFAAPNAESHIPAWEQALSVGAACMTLLAAAHAEGFVASWLTGWAAYSPIVAEALGHPGKAVAGFFFLGSPGKPLEERPRPAVGDVTSTWRG